MTMTELVLARTGRQRQRYEGEFRLVAGCIPYRLKENADECADDELENRLEVLMISSPDRTDLVFPKGGWENDETVEEAACREALEEAGVEGRLNNKVLGVWEFRSKSKQSACGMEGFCRGVMYPLQVMKEYELWPEKSSHERRWLGVKDAHKLCRYRWMQEALKAFLDYLSEEYKRQAAEAGDEEMSCLSEYEEQGQEMEQEQGVLEVAADHSIRSPCYVNSSFDTQRLDDPYDCGVVLG